MSPFHSVDDVVDRFRATGYVIDRSTATVVHLATALGRPLLAEGPPGTGKTALARTLAAVTGRRLVRLQCHEGIDESRSLYEWDYGRQLLATQLLRSQVDAALDGPLDTAMVGRAADLESLFFDERFLVERPLLSAIRSAEPAVLLIDEVDRSDDSFEALLLEVLDDYQVTIPELGTVTALHTPLVVLTSNDTRELSDALRRRALRCPFHYPDAAREREIVAARLPGSGAALVDRVVAVLQGLRRLDLRKPPGISEAIDWAAALMLLHVEELTPDVVETTLGVIVKHERDHRLALEHLAPLLAGVQGAGEGTPAARSAAGDGPVEGIAALVAAARARSGLGR